LLLMSRAGRVVCMLARQVTSLPVRNRLNRSRFRIGDKLLCAKRTGWYMGFQTPRETRHFERGRVPASAWTADSPTLCVSQTARRNQYAAAGASRSSSDAAGATMTWDTRVSAAAAVKALYQTTKRLAAKNVSEMTCFCVEWDAKLCYSVSRRCVQLA